MYRELSKEKSYSLRRMITFILISALLITAFVPLASKAGDKRETVNIVFKTNDSSMTTELSVSEDILSQGGLYLEESDYPDDPRLKEGETFLGWEDKDGNLWTKDSAPNFFIDLSQNKTELTAKVESDESLNTVEESGREEQENNGQTATEEKKQEEKQKRSISVQGNDPVTNPALDYFQLDKTGTVITGFLAEYFYKDYPDEKTLVIPKSINGNNNIKSIGANAFIELNEGKANIEKVVITDTVETIGNNAFKNCVNIADIDFSENLKTIGNSSFMGTGLTTIDSLPNTLTRIEANAFASCKELAKFDMPDSVEFLGGAVFQGTSSLKNMYLSKNTKLTNLETYAFQYSGIKKINIPGNIKSIGLKCFDSCKLEDIQLNDGLERILDDGFINGIVSETTIKIPKTVKSIGKSAFAGMADGVLDLTEFLPGQITGSTWNTKDTTKILWKDRDDSCYWIDENGYIVGIKPEGHGLGDCNNSDYHGANLNLIFPAVVQTQTDNGPETTTINGIAAYSFQNNTNVKSVRFDPNSTIETIQASTFYGCSKLETLDMGKNIKAIETAAFQSCTALKSVSLSDKLTTIGGLAFAASGPTSGWNNNKLILPDSVKYVGENSFFYRGFKEIQLNQGLERIGKAAFHQTRGLTEITIPSSVKQIDSQAFYNSYVKTINILGSDELSIHANAFDTSSIKDIYITERNKDSISGANWAAPYSTIHWANNKKGIPEVVNSDDGLWTVNRKTGYLLAYNNKCDGESVVVPSSINVSGLDGDVKITTIYGGAFKDKGIIDELTFEEGISKFHWYITEKPKVRKINFPASTITIHSYAFRNSGIEEISFAPGCKLAGIETGAFANNELKTLVLPEGVKNVDSSSFANNKLTGDIYLGSNLARVANNAFTGNDDIQKIKVNMYRKSVNQTNVVGNIGSEGAWGAKGAVAVFLGEEPIISNSAITKDGPGREFSIESTLPAGRPNILDTSYDDGQDHKSSLKPDNYAAGPDMKSKPFTAYENGKYKFIVQTNNGPYEYEVVIDDIGKMELSAMDSNFSVKNAGNITAENIIKTSKASAKDIDSGSTDAGISYSISENDMDKVNAMTKAGDKVTVTITSKYKDRYPQGAIGKNGQSISGKEYTNEVKKTIDVKLIPYETKVTFDSQGGTPATTERSITVNDVGGATLGNKMPSQPTKVHYDFAGWFTEKNGNGTEFKNTSAFKDDLTVYGKWTAKKYTLTFNTDNAETETPAAQRVLFGEKALSVADPQKSGFTFQGWARDSGDVWDFQSDKMPGNDVDLTAKWAINKYIVSFDINGGDGNNPESQEVYYKNSTKKPSDPMRKGYKFAGWYTTKPDVNKVDDRHVYSFSSKVTKDLTLYAAWTKENKKDLPKPPENVGGGNNGDPDPQDRTTTNSSRPSGGQAPEDPTRTQVESVTDPQSAQTESIPDYDVPSVNIGGNDVPLYSGSNYWALINLVLTIGGAVVLLMAGTIAIVRKKKRENDDQYLEEYYTEERKIRPLWMVITALSCIAGLLVFLLTQDMSNPMALTDNWTIVNALLFTVETISAFVALKKKEKYEEDNAAI